MPKPRFRGFTKPTTTPVPDQLFDELMHELSGAELKVLLYVTRRTLGFKKDADSISLNQMTHGIRTRDGRVLDRGVGLARSSLVRALKSLEERNIVQVLRQVDPEGVNEINVYKLNFLDGEQLTPQPASEAPGTPEDGGVVSKSDHPSPKNEPPLVRKSDDRDLTPITSGLLTWALRYA